MQVTFKVYDVCKHSIRFKATEAFQDGERVAQDITERFSVYIPNDVLLAIGHSGKAEISMEVTVR